MAKHSQNEDGFLARDALTGDRTFAAVLGTSALVHVALIALVIPNVWAESARKDAATVVRQVADVEPSVTPLKISLKVLPTEPAPTPVVKLARREAEPKVTPKPQKPRAAAKKTKPTKRRRAQARRPAAVAPRAAQPTITPVAPAVEDPAVAATPTPPAADVEAAPGPESVADASAAPSAGIAGDQPATAEPAGLPSGNDDKTLLRGYLVSVRAAVQKRVRLPRNARRARLRGKVLIGFTVDSGLQIRDVRVIESSGNPILDQAAVTSVTRMGQLPDVPAGLRLTKRTWTVPIRFG